MTAYPSLTGRRLLRELRERGYEGGYTAVTDTLREIRFARLPAFEVRFETLNDSSTPCFLRLDRVFYFFAPLIALGERGKSKNEYPALLNKMARDHV